MRAPKTCTANPPIFADLVIEANGKRAVLNVEEKGYIKRLNALLPLASRVGLVRRGKRRPNVWVNVRDGDLRYFSQVIGEMFEEGNRQMRVACIDHAGARTWLHKDGFVEQGPEPTVRW